MYQCYSEHCAVNTEAAFVSVCIVNTDFVCSVNTVVDLCISVHSEHFEVVLCRINVRREMYQCAQ